MIIHEGNTISFWITQLKERALSNGGFASKPHDDYRPDATCWAILALSDDPASQDLIRRGQARLAADQLPDGRVCLSPDHPETVWPTSLAVLAWHQSREYAKNQALAVQFLISSTGRHWPRKPDSPIANDSNLKGWPWTAKAFSWVEPTALAMMALKLAGYGDQVRVQEGTRLLLDRQLPHGGWNFGNTIVFGHELSPMPMTTGIALNALKDETPLEPIQRSLSYLESRVTSLDTPLSLGWSLLGLGAWQARPQSAKTLIYNSLKSQEKYGAYDTCSLALLLVAFKSPGGFEELYSVTKHS
jgi:hypothetical protein